VAIPVSIPIMVAAFAPIAVPVTVPTMIVVEPAAIAFPVAVKESISVMARPYPARVSIGRASPVSLMPNIAAAHWVPVAVHPIVIRSRRSWAYPNLARRRWRPNSDSD